MRGAFLRSLFGSGHLADEKGLPPGLRLEDTALALPISVKMEKPSEECDSTGQEDIVIHQGDLSRALANFSAAVARQQIGRFRQAILFGSYARGTAKDGSDVDVAVILSDMPAAVRALPLFISENP